MNLYTVLYVFRAKYNSSEPEVEPEWTESQQQVHQSFIELLEDYQDLVNIGKMTEGEYLIKSNELYRKYRDPLTMKKETIFMLMHKKDLLFWKSSMTTNNT